MKFKMNFDRYNIGAIIVALIAAILIFNFQRSIVVGDKTLYVTRAESVHEKAVGLLRHRSLGGDSGMLFIFENEGIYQFHMVGMYFPIDFIWIDADGRIVEITPNAQPQIENAKDVKLYYPARPFKYALEVNAGWAEAHQIKVGTMVSRLK